MPISIECILESAVFFPGDTIFCRVFISNLGIPNNNNNNDNNEKSKQTISWITAQVYGNLMVESSFIKLSSSRSKKKTKQQQHQQSASQDLSLDIKKKNIQTNKKIIAGVSTATSLPNLAELGENSKPIFTSPTTFLASDLYIPPGQTKSYIYYLTLPSPLPPSFKGTSLKYSYFLSIAAQVFTHPAQILTVPIRILTPASALRPIKYKSNMTFDFEEGSAETTEEYNSSSSSKNNDKQWPVSPFKKSQYFPLPYPQNLSQYDSNNTKKSVIDILNKHSSPVSIVISKGQEKIATFSICKTAFSLGDSVHGTFDFSIATIPCYKILIKLECEETVDSKYLQSTRGSNKPIRKLYGELHEFTTNLKQTHFLFHIPVEANQEFSTKYVSVKWSLRFEFITPIKSQFTPYQPPVLSSSANHNNTVMITPPSNISISLPNTPNISPLKNKNQIINSNLLDDYNNNNNNIPKSKSFEINHSRNNSFDHHNQHQYHHTQSSHQGSNTNENISYGNDDDDDEYIEKRGGNNNKRDENSDDASSHSENTIINDDTQSNGSSNFSSSTNNSKLHISSTPLSASGNFTNQNNGNLNNSTSHSIAKKKRMFNHPNIGILKEDGSTPLADTLHWSLPIRVLVGFPPHELLHTNKNELIL
ncbi:hypothetical protein DICPUDRAFT_82408 [Dictyostelium purpureum]|uniref:Rgp1-domain-containing protein n=1 Tax=Dictyostelium purpureum TaxID=5786 RepID=F0ZWF3_DICPU|nr:uncharacterized protein DICPUDRAFT_82408 [Dictyostelium purpureum]EGC31713.1 hypothetical protein DICPUDRAFT_82408 [Dictyostelium purpureum]|eukprot:XP_003291747.1 hypothetical protein DICPUDRAFT_82408 [Dictyostelium purpureum]